ILSSSNLISAGGKGGSRFESKRDSLSHGLQKRRLTSVSLASLALSQNIRDSNIYEEEEDEYTKEEKEYAEKQNEIDNRQSPWFSLWLGNVCQCMCGIQFSIYMMSMWPYLSKLDDTADLTFLGWIIAAYSVGQAIASPLFGIWNQRTMSTRYPVALGLVFCIIGNAIYGILPTFASGIKWIMLVSRFIIGFGSGNYAVLRSYTASASVARDRTKAIALATGSYVLGISFGPAIQMCFSPINDGFVLGPFHFNMFTFPAFAMCIINVISLVLIITVFKEEYAGILSKSDRSGKDGEYFVLPKTDWVACSVCIYMFFIQNCVSTMMETLSSPITMALYGFDDQQTVVASGIAQAVSSVIEIFNNALLAFTRLGKVNPRYILLVGLAGFSFYHLCILPYPFFTTPLEFTDNSTDGLGCYYEWCKTMPQVPQPVYWTGYIVGIGLGFPFIANPTGTLFSEIIGPRNQGNLQGIMALFGSIARIIAPIVSTALFQSTGYMWPMLAELAVLVLGFIVVFIFWKRLVPLKIAPKGGKSLKYKNGIFYKL
ncbi:hypothetical protein PENTCL1PPCAC_2181, partial [Pristionchus entomophagus]